MPKKIIKRTKQAQGVTQTATSVRQKRDVDPKAARKKAFLQAYEASGFNISEACRQANLDRKTFYRWKQADPEFLDDILEVEDSLKDYLKSKLLTLVEQGNLIATIFACKSLAGMAETTKQDIQITKGPEYSQQQLDAMVRGQQIDRKRYSDILGL